MKIKIHEDRDSEDYLQELYDSFESAWDKSKFNLSKGYDPYYDCQCIRISLKDDPGFYSLTYTIEPSDANFVADRPKSFQTIWRYPNDHGVGVGEEREFQDTDLDEYGKEVFDYFDDIKERSARKDRFESKKSEGNLDINDAYGKFTDVLGHYNDNTANFLKDCVYIAHSRGENGVNGLRKQGYKLNLAAMLDDDTLHTCYVKDDGGHKAIDLYFDPHRRVVEVVLLGFHPEYPNADNTKVFSVQKGSKAFADFIENVSDYKGESKMSEDVSDELKGIDVKDGTIMADVVDWAEYEVGEGYSSVKEVLETLMEKGVYSGMTFLVEYEDGKNFFEEHKQEINEILAEAMADQGQFPELQDFDKGDPLCLGPQNQFCISAFAFERVASDLLDMILDKE